MIKKIVIIICSALLLFVSICFGVRLYIDYKYENTSVYVASHNISQRSKICEEDLLKIELPKSIINDDVLIDADDIIDKYVKLSYSIPKGSLIYKGSLESDIKDLAHTLLKEGEVNYDLYTNDIKINTANLSKNMFIDMYLTISKNDKPISDILIENARITGLYDTNNKAINDFDNESRINIVTIAVNKDYVNIINKALVLGDINCVVNSNTYNNRLNSKINTDSKLFEYLQ